MQNVRSVLFILTAAASLALLALLTVSVTVALSIFLSATLVAKALSAKLKPIPVKADNRKQSPRIWNDGHGTIIDL